MTEFFLTGVALGLAAGISPGPILALVVAQTIRYGRREGVIVAFAPLLSDFPIVTLALLLLSRIPDNGVLMGAISIAGGLFLAALGVESSRAVPLTSGTSTGAPRSLPKAVTLNLLNPHVYLFWATVGGPLLIRGSASGPAVPAAFLSAFYICLIGSKVAVAILLGRARHLLTGRAYVYILRALGAVLFLLAAWLFRDGLIQLGFVW